MLLAKSLQERAADREKRAKETDIVDVRLLDLAARDRAESDLYCQRGSLVLKELVTKSPGAMNHGWVLHWLNRILAANADAREQTDLRDQYLLDAATALERELARQPFNQEITIEFLRTAGPSLEPQRFLDLLARPLRYDRATRPYMEFLAEHAADPSFEARFDAVVQVARQTLTSDPSTEQIALLADTWTPEKLRLAATLRFRRGDYDRATLILEQAARIYAALDKSPAIAAASCLAELADSRFFSRPNEPDRAMAVADRAEDLAPPSLAGRRLTASIRQRKVDYLLAADREEQALALLKQTAPANVTEADVLSELGARYRGLCDSLLRRRLALQLRQSPDALLDKLDRWIKRALELNPQDGAAHYLAADLAFHNGACDAAADQLRQAILNGFPVDVAARFLAVALEKAPDCEALSVLSSQLQRLRGRAGFPQSDGPADSPDEQP
jgi:tetratricopeptide (TPR) repeat protein